MITSLSKGGCFEEDEFFGAAGYLGDTGASADMGSSIVIWVSGGTEALGGLMGLRVLYGLPALLCLGALGSFGDFGDFVALGALESLERVDRCG